MTPYRNLLFSRRELLAGTAGLGALSGCVGSRGRFDRNTLTVWHSWGGVMGPRIQKVLAAYRRSHPDVTVRDVFARNDLSSNQKFFTSVAAGTPPDVTFVDGPQVASWAEWGALEPLTQRVETNGIRPEDYFPPTWRQTIYRDQVWALTYCADPNFAFVWNKALFKKVGLNPDKPPETIDELTEMAHRLTVIEGSVVKRMGLIPWEQYGPANSIFTWGWAFGGDFYDYETRMITADHPKVVAALEWMASFARRYDPSRIQSMREGLGGEQDPFYIDQLVMRCRHIAGINDVARYAPKLDYGITFIPAPRDGEAHSSWVGGWCMAIPKGCRNPDRAWDFIRWFCHSEEGTALVGREQLLLPGMRRSPFFREALKKRNYAQFVRILEESRHQRPVMPAQALYMREMQRAVESVVYGRKTPARALADAKSNTQSELDLILAG